MEGCPYCVEFKDLLKSDKINYVDLDINENKEEYDMFVKITNNDYVPAFMIIDEENNKTEFFAPDRDFSEVSEGIDIIKNKFQQ